jgi:hypothetical protein
MNETCDWRVYLSDWRVLLCKRKQVEAELVIGEIFSVIGVYSSVKGSKRRKFPGKL